jgi:hypothetical protein
MKSLPILSLVVLLAVSTSCGGGQPKAKSSRSGDDRAFRTGEAEDDMGVSAEVGGLNQDKVKRVFNRAMKGFTNCLTEGWERLEFMSGEVNFYVAVDRDGSVKHTYLEQSTLGDRQTEKCMLQVIRDQQWPKPVGGKVGEARNSLIFDAPDDVRPPVDWAPDEILDALEKVRGDVEGCKQGTTRAFEITMYVGTDGKPIAVGAAPPGVEADLAIDCMVGVLMGAKFPSPGSWPAKVTFQL